MIRFNKPTLKRIDMDCVLQTMVDEHIGPGEKNTAFNQAFAMSCGCTSSVSFRTYNDCIAKALEVAELCEDSVVAISPLSPAVYMEELEKAGCKVVFVDVDRENGLPDSDSVLKSEAQALILYDVCASIPMKYNRGTSSYEKVNYGDIKIIEDISQSIGSQFGESVKAGDWGDIVICSLEENDVVSAGGGAVLSVKEYLSDKIGENDTNYLKKLSDINASLGLIQLENLENNSKKRREICEVYASGMISTNHKRFGLVSLDYKSNGSVFSVFMDCKPDNLIEFAKRHDVPVIMTFASSICSIADGDLFEKYPNAASYYYRTVSFPVYPFLDVQEIKSISKIVANLP